MAKADQQFSPVYTNNRWEFEFQVVDEDDPAEPPLSIAGHTIYFALTRFNSRGQPIVGSPLLDFNSVDDPSVVMITNAAQGQGIVILPASITIDVPPKDYYLEIEDKDASGNPVVVSTGTLPVLPNVVNS